MDKVSSGSVVYRCVLHICSVCVCVGVGVCVWCGCVCVGVGVCVCVWGGGGQDILNTMHVFNIHSIESGESRWIENTNDHWLLPAMGV